ncbi:MAG: hypothetical protein ACJ790_14550, partial [Myxococcaceae bacterium]
MRKWLVGLACIALAGCGGSMGEAQMQVGGTNTDSTRDTSAPEATPDDPTAPTVTPTDPGSVNTGGGAGGGTGQVTPGGPNGLPCDVAQILQTQCQSCHGAQLAGGAPIRLMTRDDLLAQSLSYPGQTIGARVVARMKSTVAPMPPGNPVTASVATTVESWVSSGMPAGTCGGTGSTDGGTPTGNGGAPGTDPGSPGPVTPPVSVCTSGAHWTSGNTGSASMNPGLACISCHQSRGAPTFSAAGTVYPTVREPNLCNGANGVTVQITDKNG